MIETIQSGAIDSARGRGRPSISGSTRRNSDDCARPPPDRDSPPAVGPPAGSRRHHRRGAQAAVQSCPDDGVIADVGGACTAEGGGAAENRPSPRGRLPLEGHVRRRAIGCASPPEDSVARRAQVGPALSIRSRDGRLVGAVRVATPLRKPFCFYSPVTEGGDSSRAGRPPHG